ncbi:MAG: hypothetical protein Aurels2KO_54330 [Aureliella sp.]
MIVSGCAQWSGRTTETEPTKAALPSLKIRPDAIVVEATVIRLPPHIVEQLPEFWTSVDETIIDIEQRYQLERNGLRAGMLVGEFPALLRQHLSDTKTDEATGALEMAGLASDANSLARRLQCRAGRRKELVVRSEISEPINVFTSLDGQHVSGETFQRATTLFDLRAIPNPDGSARITLTPEIQHGELRQAYVSNDFGVRPELRRDQVMWKELTIDTTMQEGQVLIVAGSQPPRCIGNAFFVSNNADRGHDHLILAIRLAETQLDDLFRPEEIAQATALSEQ